MLKLILVLLNPILKKFYSKRIELSAWGFYAGLSKSVPFFVDKLECSQLRKNFDELRRNYVGTDLESFSFLIYLRQYTYGLAAIQNQRGTDTEGYRYVLPFQCAQFIGFSANKKSKLADIISPKMDLIKYLTQRVPNLRGKFYHKNKRNSRYDDK